MKVFAFLLLFFIQNSFAKEGKVLWSEQLVFKVGDKVFLLDDLNKIGKSLKEAQCLLPNSSALMSLELDPKSLPEVLDFHSLGNIDLSEEHLYVERLLRLEKLKVFLGQQSYDLDVKSLSGLNFSKCGLGQYESLSKELKSIIKLEAFWGERFSPDVFKLGFKDIEELRKKYPQSKGAAFQKILDEERSKRIKESALNFIKTIEKQVPHDAFF